MKNQQRIHWCKVSSYNTIFSMKRLAVLLIILMTWLPAWCREDPLWSPDRKDTLGILRAKQANRIRVAVRGAYNPHYGRTNPVSSHYGECMELRIENLTDSLLNVVLPCGTMLLSLDSSAQNMLVSETRHFTLAPRQRKYERINALCAELYKNAPDVYVNYEVGNLAPQPLLRLAHVIEANSAQNKAGQYAVWAVTDKATKNELGEDYESLQAGQKLLDMAGISFNIMGKQETASLAPRTENRLTDNIGMPTNRKTAEESVVAVNPAVNTHTDTTNAAVDDTQEKIARLSVEEPQYKNSDEEKPSSEWGVYLTGALLLGLGLYVLGKNAARHRVG